jgi:hypothetical protein
MRRHVETNWKRVPKEQLKTYRSRLRYQAVAALLDLALVAEREPEDQLQQIFTPEIVEILIQALIGQGCEAIHPRHHEIARVMLNAAYKRLQTLIDTDYRPMVIDSLNTGVTLLTMIPVPKEPRQMRPETVNDQREKTQRQRTRIMRDHLSWQLLEKHDQ